jgi:hypothetical protein
VGTAPVPGIAEPEFRKYREFSGFRAAVPHGDPHEDVLGGSLGVFDKHVKIAVLVKDSGVVQLELGFGFRAPCILAAQFFVGKGCLRVLVEAPEVGMGGGGVEVVVVLLGILPVVALRIGQSEEPFLQDGILPVPKGEGKGEAAAPVADSQ